MSRACCACWGLRGVVAAFMIMGLICQIVVWCCTRLPVKLMHALLTKHGRLPLTGGWYLVSDAVTCSLGVGTAAVAGGVCVHSIELSGAV